MKVGDVILYKTDIPSFSWNNGLKVIIYIDDELIYFSTINEDGTAQKFDDGRYMCSATSNKNEYIYPTKMTYQLEENFTFL